MRTTKPTAISLIAKVIAAGAVSIALMIAGSAAAAATNAAGSSTSSISWDGFYHDM